jgi:hypothetical protein
MANIYGHRHKDDQSPERQRAGLVVAYRSLTLPTRTVLIAKFLLVMVYDD